LLAQPVQMWLTDMANVARSIFQLAYEISPIFLTNGAAQNIPGQMLPIVAITEAASFAGNILEGNGAPDLDQFVSRFRPLPGSTLIDNEIGDYPFANQAVAANAIIAKPLRLSMLMNSPANQGGGYVSKLITFTALKAALDQHNQSGGTYTVLTPSFIYTNCIMTNMVDVSRPDSQQPQNAWQFEFVRPLLTENESQSVLNSLMSKLEAQLPIPSQSGAIGWSGLNATYLNPAGPVGSTIPRISNTFGSTSNIASNLMPSSNWY